MLGQLYHSPVVAVGQVLQGLKGQTLLEERDVAVDEEYVRPARVNRLNWPGAAQFAVGLEHVALRVDGKHDRGSVVAALAIVVRAKVIGFHGSVSLRLGHVRRAHVETAAVGGANIPLGAGSI